MPNNKQTSPSLASVAGEVLQDSSSSQIARKLAASVLSQTGSNHRTGADMEETAARVLASPKYSDQTRSLAA